MEIKEFTKGQLDASSAAKGVEFIRRRFQEDWGVTRIDVTQNSLRDRHNFVLFDKAQVIGWLGLESDGELDNGCIDLKYQGKGFLTKLLRFAFAHSLDCRYGLFPLNYYPSAVSCCTASHGKMRVTDTVISKTYPEKVVRLVKICIDPTCNISKQQLVNTLKRIK